VFTVTPQQETRGRNWITARRAERESCGRCSMLRSCDHHAPPHPAGAVTWSFTETSIGVIIRVSCGQAELDLTDYASL
jgi:hypothetical protein